METPLQLGKEDRSLDEVNPLMSIERVLALVYLWTFPWSYIYLRSYVYLTLSQVHSPPQFPVIGLFLLLLLSQSWIGRRFFRIFLEVAKLHQYFFMNPREQVSWCLVKAIKSPSKQCLSMHLAFAVILTSGSLWPPVAWSGKHSHQLKSLPFSQIKPWGQIQSYITEC